MAVGRPGKGYVDLVVGKGLVQVCSGNVGGPLLKGQFQVLLGLVAGHPGSAALLRVQLGNAA